MEIDGIKYSKEAVVVLSANVLPDFGMIIDILLIEANLCLPVCEILENQGFEEHTCI